MYDWKLYLALFNETHKFSITFVRDAYYVNYLKHFYSKITRTDSMNLFLLSSAKFGDLDVLNQKARATKLEFFKQILIVVIKYNANVLFKVVPYLIKHG